MIIVVSEVRDYHTVTIEGSIQRAVGVVAYQDEIVIVSSPAFSYRHNLTVWLQGQAAGIILASDIRSQHTITVEGKVQRAIRVVACQSKTSATPACDNDLTIGLHGHGIARIFSAGKVSRYQAIAIEGGIQ